MLCPPRSTVLQQTSTQGCKAGVNPLALSEDSESRKRSRTSLPAAGAGKRSVRLRLVTEMQSNRFKVVVFLLVKCSYLSLSKATERGEKNP